MDRLVAYQRVTEELIELLQNKELDRDVVIDKVDELLGRRDDFLKEIVPPYSSEEIITGKNLIELEKQINPLLQGMKISIKKDISDLSVKKQGNQKYINPYNNLMTDGVFYDKRK
ncbi:flagellar protein FliT [Peribacillus alkalitolerans]|uniref:flagellar protein FliT n=1 Tax=Peribacillus alkalitolerans TaxID=1550385 RepID=UPI0013D7F804|nr:flagellar protein FliT [Peribacillus alkalitolerans]